jgi:hypothetical protein
MSRHSNIGCTGIFVMRKKSMRKITLEVMILIAGQAPEFLESVEKALAKDGAVLLVLDGYEGESEIVYVCL